jgi:hypothetical protein
VLAAPAEHHVIAEKGVLRLRSGAVSRDVTACLARELTPVMLRELSVPFGLIHPDSVSNLIRLADRVLLCSLSLFTQVALRRAFTIRAIFFRINLFFDPRSPGVQAAECIPWRGLPPSFLDGSRPLRAPELIDPPQTSSFVGTPTRVCLEVGIRLAP